MALIKCTECGKEFSDRAAACPNCGCPTDIILEDIEKEKSIQQKKIVASYDIGDYKFEIDSKMDYRIQQASTLLYISRSNPSERCALSKQVNSKESVVKAGRTQEINCSLDTFAKFSDFGLQEGTAYMM